MIEITCQTCLIVEASPKKYHKLLPLGACVSGGGDDPPHGVFNKFAAPPKGEQGVIELFANLADFASSTAPASSADPPNDQATGTFFSAQFL